MRKKPSYELGGELRFGPNQRTICGEPDLRSAVEGKEVEIGWYEYIEYAVAGVRMVRHYSIGSGFVRAE